MAGPRSNAALLLLCTGILIISCFLPGAHGYVALSGWKSGRSTYYGPFDTAGGSAKDTNIGSCGYGYIPRNSFPWGFGAAPVRSSRLDLFTSLGCGSCVEVRCTGTPLAGSGNPCFSMSRTVVAQTIDSCPCYQASNVDSNKRWCCGDKAHIDLTTAAFQKLALLSVGVINTEYRQVTCDFVNGIIITADGASNDYWLGTRFQYVGDGGALLYAEAKVAGGSWIRMQRGWGATYVLSHSMVQSGKPLRKPISLRITLKGSQRSLTFWNIITSIQAGRNYWTNVQFQILTPSSSKRHLLEASDVTNNGTAAAGLSTGAGATPGAEVITLAAALELVGGNNTLQIGDRRGCTRITHNAFNCTGVPQWDEEDHNALDALLMLSNGAVQYDDSPAAPGSDVALALAGEIPDNEDMVGAGAVPTDAATQFGSVVAGSSGEPELRQSLDSQPSADSAIGQRPVDSSDAPVSADTIRDPDLDFPMPAAIFLPEVSSTGLDTLPEPASVVQQRRSLLASAALTDASAAAGGASAAAASDTGMSPQHVDVYVQGLTDAWDDTSYGINTVVDFDSAGGLNGGPCISVQMDTSGDGGLAVSTGDDTPFYGPGSVHLWFRQANASCRVDPMKLSVVLEGYDVRDTIASEAIRRLNARRCMHNELPVAASDDLAATAQALADGCSFEPMAAAARGGTFGVLSGHFSALVADAAIDGWYNESIAYFAPPASADDNSTAVPAPMNATTGNATAGNTTDVAPPPVPAPMATTANFTQMMSARAMSAGCGSRYCPDMAQADPDSPIFWTCLVYPGAGAADAVSEEARGLNECGANAGALARAQAAAYFSAVQGETAPVFMEPDATPWVGLKASFTDHGGQAWDRIIVRDLSKSGCPFYLDSVSLDMLA